MIQLSVLTVNLNNAEGLQKTIESVIGQTFKEFEFIIIDGASADRSLEIIHKVAEQAMPGFQWISEPDSGAYEAMNKGIQRAQGDYLLFLNSGDFLVNKNILKEVFVRRHDAGFLLGKCHVSENGKVIYTTNPPEKMTFGYLYRNALAHQATFIKREMFSKYGNYREDFRYNADIEFWYRTIILNGCSTETLPVVVSEYNTEGISGTEKYTERYGKEMEEIFSHPVLQKFIPDYEEWEKEKEDLKILSWARSKPLINCFVSGLYKIACLKSKMFK